MVGVMVFLTGGVPRGLDTCHSPFRAVGGSLPYRHSDYGSRVDEVSSSVVSAVCPKVENSGCGEGRCARRDSGAWYRAVCAVCVGLGLEACTGRMVSLCPFGARGFKSHSRRQPRPAFRFLVRSFSLRGFASRECFACFLFFLVVVVWLVGAGFWLVSGFRVWIGNFLGRGKAIGNPWKICLVGLC